MGDWTASSGERVFACPTSVVLPRVDSTSEDAERGSDIHGFTSRRIRGMNKTAALSMVAPANRPMCEALRIEEALSGLTDVRAEVSYAYDAAAETWRELGEDLGRRYPPTAATEIAGSIDVEGTRADGIPVAADWKFGFGNLTPCRDNVQILYFARVLSMKHGASEVEGRLMTGRPNGRVSVDSHVFSAFDLDVFADRMVRAHERVEAARETLRRGDTPPVAIGPHCRYCPCLPSCPAYAGLVRSMVPDVERLADQVEAMTPEQGGAAWLKLQSNELLAERVRVGLKALASRAPLPVGNGKAVTELTVPVTRFVAARALEMLKAKGATEEDIESLYNTADETQFRIVKRR